MNSNPHKDAPPSLSTQLAQLLERAARSNFLIRLGAVIAALWFWLTLLRFTLGASEGAYQLPSRFGGFGNELTTILFTGVVTLAAVIPAILVWIQLLLLTRVLSHLIIRTLYWDTSSDGEEQAVQVHSVQGLIEKLIDIFVSWFRFFAITWIIILIANALGSIVILFILWTQGYF